MARYYRQRAIESQVVSIRGKIIIPAQTAWTIGCQIRDFSTEGAKIELDEDIALPERVMLFEALRQNIYECLVRWTLDRTVGLVFIDVCKAATRRALIDNGSLGLLRPEPGPELMLTRPLAEPSSPVGNGQA